MLRQEFVFLPRDVVSLDIDQSEKEFPVNRIFCVGRNYAEHSKEMGDDPERDPPFFFCKDSSSIVKSPFDGVSEVSYPSGTNQYEYEVELVVALSKGGKNLSEASASDAIFGYAVGLDMTRRDLQTQAKEKGRPWEVGKSFDQSAPMSPIKTVQQIGRINKGNIELKVDGVTKQKSDLSCLTWSVVEVISRLSNLFELHPGDLIMTGTPENVGSVEVGEMMSASIESVGGFQVKIIK